MIKSVYHKFTENIILNDETLTKLSLNQKQEDHLYHSHLPARCRAAPVEEDEETKVTFIPRRSAYLPRKPKPSTDKMLELNHIHPPDPAVGME